MPTLQAVQIACLVDSDTLAARICDDGIELSLAEKYTAYQLKPCFVLPQEAIRVLSVFLDAPTEKGVDIDHTSPAPISCRYRPDLGAVEFRYRDEELQRDATVLATPKELTPLKRLLEEAWQRHLRKEQESRPTFGL